MSNSVILNSPLFSRLNNSEYKNKYADFLTVVEPNINNLHYHEPYMTDHGEVHIKNVMDNADKFLGKNAFVLDEAEIYYLMLSITIHDFAMANYENDRPNHNLRIKEVFDKISKDNTRINTILDDGEKYIIYTVSRAHSGKDANAAYNSVITDRQYVKGALRKINLPFLAMLLRISDELDITQERIKHQPFEAVYPNMDNDSKLHWLKHKAISGWYFDKKAKTHITLSFIPNIEEYILEPEPKIRMEKFIEFMARLLNKFQIELKTIKTICKNNFESDNHQDWKWDELELDILDAEDNNNSGYIQTLRNKLKSGMDITSFISDESLSDVDSNVRENQNRKLNITEQSSVHKKGNYNLIGDDSYRKNLDAYIINHSMFKNGCYKHKYLNADGDKYLKILSWLDSFAFHQNNILLRDSGNIIANVLRDKKVDYIVGLGLKGAKIASIVSFKLEIPLLFFIMGDDEKYKVNIFGTDLKQEYKIAMVTDCIITGNTASTCHEQLEEKGLKFTNVGVFSVFLRNSDNVKNDNVLMQKKIPIYTINDHYTYQRCSLPEEKCSLYETHGESIYEKSYKKRKK